MNAHAAVAVALAKELGIPANDAVVLSDLTNVLVHLRPSPVVARVSLTLAGRGPKALEQELAFAAAAASAGAPVVPPVEPTPFERDGRLVTLWRYVEHRRPEPADAPAVARSLRALHEAVAGCDFGLPRFDRLDEAAAKLATLEPDEAASEDDLARMAAAIAASRTRLAALDLDERPIHGDAHFGNVLVGADGPVWADLENVCDGPVEYDLACLAWRGRVHGAAGYEEAIAAYGPHDARLVEELQPVLAAFLCVWNTDIVQRAGGPAMHPFLRERLDYLKTFV